MDDEKTIKYLTSNSLEMESMVLPDASAALQNLLISLKKLLGQQVYETGEALDEAFRMFKI